jgi:uroporphyrinogen-III synthase
LKPLLVLRPEPGNGATATRARALGLEVRQCPLFRVEPVAWTAPDPRGFDFLLLTSANALRLGGEELAKLRSIPVVAVGPMTAAAARAAGFDVAVVGTEGVEALLATVPAGSRLLHLAGIDHRRPDDRHSVTMIPLYRATPLDPVLPDEPCVALVHSPRAGARLAVLVADRSQIAIAAISAAAAAACGEEWATVESVARPDDTALLALAARLCQD